MGNLGGAELLLITPALVFWVALAAGAVWLTRRALRHGRELDELRQRVALLENELAP